MAKANKKPKPEPTEFVISELHKLKMENLVLKMAATARQHKDLETRYDNLMNERNAVIEEARLDTRAPKDWLMSSNLDKFVPPPPADE